MHKTVAIDPSGAASGYGVAGLPSNAVGALARLRQRRPRVHCITNSVAQNFTSNVLLAIGAVPSMTISAGEVASFVESADALLVNLGTFDAERAAAIDLAVGAARRANRPWVLDPVFVDRAPPRAAFALQLIGRKPDVVRLNHAEFAAISAEQSSPGAVVGFARAHRLTVALSGASDFVSDGTQSVTIGNGDSLMAKVTAMGCAVSALTAACLAVEPDPFHACTAALLIAGIAGEVAAEQAAGPGSFAVAILDAFHGLDSATIMSRAKVA